MARPKRQNTNKSNATDVASGTVPAEERGTELPSAWPTNQVQSIVSALIIGQLGILVLGLLANLTPSYVQGNLLDWTSIYSVTTAQDYGAIPLEWTHGEAMEYPVVVQVQLAADPNKWKSLSPPSTVITDARPVNWTRSRYANLSRAVRLLYSDTEDNEILGELAVAFLRAAPVRDVDGIQAVRVVSPSVIDYQQHQDLLQAPDLTLVEAYPDAVLYTASVVESSTSEFTLIPALDPLRTSKSRIDRGGDLP